MIESKEDQPNEKAEEEPNKDDETLALPEVFMKNKKIGIIVMIGLALCLLVIGMTVRYNNLVRAYNIVAEEANDCRMRDNPMIYHGIPDLNIFGPVKIGDAENENIYKETGWTNCGCKEGFEGGITLDPFMGSGTTALVALKLKRRFIGIELNKSYINMSNKRIQTYLTQTKL